MSKWMYAHSLPLEDHPDGCSCGGCDADADIYTVYEYQRPGEMGNLFFNDIDDLMSTLRDEIANNDLFPGEIDLHVKVHKMTAAQYEALPMLED